LQFGFERFHLGHATASGYVSAFQWLSGDGIEFGDWLYPNNILAVLRI